MIHTLAIAVAWVVLLGLSLFGLIAALAWWGGMERPHLHEDCDYCRSRDEASVRRLPEIDLPLERDDD